MLAPASLPAALDLRRSRGLLYRENVYYKEEPGRGAAANLLTKDEARRVVSNIAKLPKFKMGGAAL